MTTQTLRTLRCYGAHKLAIRKSEAGYLEDICKVLDRVEFVMSMLEQLMKDKQFLEPSTAYLVEKLYSILTYGKYINE